ncbi:DUF3050 domain-containing protein [Pseudomonas sp. FP2309]|uniref:DUF3050 domain-containing protein n=1 Tax=Pseudomonas sp. FP2309 TaxID=2954091 RepID=UPI0027340220|nr:DUF3050 domain-containing protein [Pseudomonas sp. FP2309]WLH68650.1 DUF3050 domain-containing protein [Pseudomonas sp. FP2309]
MQSSLIEQKQHQLCGHSLFSEITSQRKLQVFMEHHIFAVWDFMTLTKRLQQDLTCTRLPWLPPADPQAARLINEIVLGEESDEHPRHGHCSHFEWYLEAMAEVGANTRAINRFITLQREGVEASTALHMIDAPAGAIRFVSETLHVARHAPTHRVAAAFFYGREHVIPSMFRHLLQSDTLIRLQAPALRGYLERHIELDAQSHGPAAAQLLDRLVAKDPVYPRHASDAALSAMQNRITLWDEVQAALQEVQP